MARTGDLTLYQPGDTVTAELVADASGNVATRGQGVEIVGEGSNGNPQVRLVSTDGAGIGRLPKAADGHDEDATYAAGEVVDVATEVELNGPIDWWEPAGDYAAPAPGDRVVMAAGGGVTSYDPAGTPADTPVMVLGAVWTTVSGDFGPGDRIAVYRFR